MDRVGTSNDLLKQQNQATPHVMKEESVVELYECSDAIRFKPAKLDVLNFHRLLHLIESKFPVKSSHRSPSINQNSFQVSYDFLIECKERALLANQPLR